MLDYRRILLPALFLAAFPGMSPASAQAGPSAVRPQPGKPAPDAAAMYANACYQGIDPKGDVCLKNGRSATLPTSPTVKLSPKRVSGDLDGDGAPETALLLTSERGGSGPSVYLAVAALRGDRIVNLATAPLGERVKVRFLRISSGKLRLDVLRPASGDAACCPTELATRTFTLIPGKLVEGPVQVTGRLSRDQMDRH